MDDVIVLVAAVAIAWGWCLVLPSLGPRLGMVDVPADDGLKVHTSPAVPLAGPGLALGLILVLATTGGESVALLVGLVLITTLGTVDDRFGLTPRLRLGAELLVASLVATRWLDSGILVFLFGLVVIVVAINAINLYDGLDLLAGSTGLVGLLLIGAAALVTDGVSAWPAWGLAAGLVGFLPHNRPPAKVFLGDGGAYLIGAATAVVTIDVGVAVGGPAVPAVLGFLGMFAVDLATTILRRWRSGAELFAGDRSHIYDRLVTSGRPVLAVVLRLVTVHALVVAACVVAVLALPAWGALGAVVTIGIVTTAFSWRDPTPVDSRR